MSIGVDITMGVALSGAALWIGCAITELAGTSMFFIRRSKFIQQDLWDAESRERVLASDVAVLRASMTIPGRHSQARGLFPVDLRVMQGHRDYNRFVHSVDGRTFAIQGPAPKLMSVCFTVYDRIIDRFNDILYRAIDDALEEWWRCVRDDMLKDFCLLAEEALNQQRQSITNGKPSWSYARAPRL